MTIGEVWACQYPIRAITGRPQCDRSVESQAAYCAVARRTPGESDKTRRAAIQRDGLYEINVFLPRAYRYADGILSGLKHRPRQVVIYSAICNKRCERYAWILKAGWHISRELAQCLNLSRTNMLNDPILYGQGVVVG